MSYRCCQWRDLVEKGCPLTGWTTGWGIMTAKDIRMKCLIGKTSVRYIQKTLQKKLGMLTRKPAIKPVLTLKLKMKRLAFAKKNSIWSENSGWMSCFQMSPHVGLSTPKMWEWGGQKPKTSTRASSPSPSFYRKVSTVSWSGVATVEKWPGEACTAIGKSWSCRITWAQPWTFTERRHSCERRPLPQEQGSDGDTEEGEVFNPGLAREL